MRSVFCVLFLFSLVLSRDYLAMEVNELTPEDLDEFFSDESERYLFLAFRGDQCLSCNWQLYYPNLLTYHFEKENDMIFGTIETSKAGRAAEFCDVDPESARLELRIITKGGARCEQYLDTQSLTDFVTEATGKIAKKSYVMNHSKPSFDAMRSDTSKSHLIEIMSPFERACYDFSIQMEKAAEAFAMEPSVDFNRVDCSLMHDLCDELSITGVPALMFLPGEGVEYNNTYPEYPTVNGIVSYLNGLLGTHRGPDGGLDGDYGRDDELDALAEQFTLGDEEKRREIMRRVKKERKLHINSAIYYVMMRDMMANGTEIVFDRVNSTLYELQGMEVTDPRYAPLIARLNIFHVFEPIEPTRSILMTPQNVDRVLNGERNVMVLFYDIRCPVCREFAKVFRDAFDKHPFSVYFASVNAGHYESLRIRFNITDHPMLKYFPAGKPIDTPLDIPERTAEGIVEWLYGQLAKQEEEKKEQEQKEEAELASHLDEEEEEQIPSETGVEEEL